MATPSSILAWRIPWTEEPGGLQSMGVTESDTTERLTLSHFALLENAALGAVPSAVQRESWVSQRTHSSCLEKS